MFKLLIIQISRTHICSYIYIAIILNPLSSKKLHHSMLTSIYPKYSATSPTNAIKSQQMIELVNGNMHAFCHSLIAFSLVPQTQNSRNFELPRRRTLQRCKINNASRRVQLPGVSGRFIFIDTHFHAANVAICFVRVLSRV